MNLLATWSDLCCRAVLSSSPWGDRVGGLGGLVWLCKDGSAGRKQGLGQWAMSKMTNMTLARMRVVSTDH